MTLRGDSGNPLYIELVEELTDRAEKMVFPLQREQAYCLIQLTLRRLASYYSDDEILNILTSIRTHSKALKKS